MALVYNTPLSDVDIRMFTAKYQTTTKVIIHVVILLNAWCPWQMAEGVDTCNKRNPSLIASCNMKERSTVLKLNCGFPPFKILKL